MVELANDKVINVRMILAETVKRHIQKGGALSTNEMIISLRDKLKKDPDQEIQEVF